MLLAVEPCDMHKRFNGLSALASDHLREDPRHGVLFGFTNRRRTRLKILYWGGTGLWGVIKRLEEGTFSWPKPGDPNARKMRLAPEALAMRTYGVDLRGARLRPWNGRDEKKLRIVLRRRWVRGLRSADGHPDSTRT